MIAERIVILPLLALLAGAAAPSAPADPARQMPVAGSTLRESDARVGAVAYRLASAPGAECSDPYPLTGLLFHHLAEYLPADRLLMIERYRLDRGPGVLTVVAGSPAAEAGLRAGDVLLAVNDKRLASGASIATESKRKRWRKLAEASEADLEAALRQGPARLLMLRDGREIGLSLGSRPGCVGRVRLARSTQVNAFASGSYVIMTTAMLDYLRSDDELAVVLGHEMSHNILRHPQLLDEQGVPKKGILRAFGKNAARVWKTEEEADRLGIRLLWRAGYDVNAVIPFWRRYLGRYDMLPQIFRTHPSLPVRERITREEIAALPSERPRQPSAN